MDHLCLIDGARLTFFNILAVTTLHLPPTTPVGWQPCLLDCAVLGTVTSTRWCVAVSPVLQYKRADFVRSALWIPELRRVLHALLAYIRAEKCDDTAYLPFPSCQFAR